MGRHCCVTSCRSYTASGRTVNGLSFFKFPAWKKTEGGKVAEITKRRRMAWVAAVRRANITFNYAPASMKVCSRHFHTGKPAYEMFESHPDWAPSLNLGHDEANAAETEQSVRHTSKAELRPIAADDPEPTEDHPEPAENRTDPVGNYAEPASIIVELTEEAAGEAGGGPAPKEMIECDFCGYRRAEINRLLKENRELKCALAKRNMDEESLKEDNMKVKYYTGLPCFGLLMSMLSTVMPCLPTSVRTLTPFQMVFLTLMRLRLNLPLQHLAYIFHVDKRVVVTIFNTTINALHSQLSPLVSWPNREHLRQTMPPQFMKAFGDRVVVILDCFEIFTEGASNQRAPFFYNKHTNTVKYLIGKTPQGAISFISKGWGGHVSDKYVTENSGLIDSLLPGDLVLADRGFDSVGLICAEVTTPADPNGPLQFDTKDVKEIRPIAHLRTHVEKMIGTIRNMYTMLCGPIPMKMAQVCQGEELTFLDKMVTVCCVLTIMYPSGLVDPTSYCAEPV
ncbi:uncharacterized protein LOC132453873 [Gadus macrocephalus]|uniref:uncharacterized protein LOC132453873 n=1 Tax=Gadus macrocephalus TaxID=80720 RepID=UPI0028CBAA61|nr:uncharacterized protein LOC132453873 [Gadus macrocephalus]